MDATKLFALACQDVVERFHLALILTFVVVEEMGNRWGPGAGGRAGASVGPPMQWSSMGLPAQEEKRHGQLARAPPAHHRHRRAHPPPRSGALAPNRELLAGCARIFCGEIVIDVIKHAVLGKFNEIRCALQLQL